MDFMRELGKIYSLIDKSVMLALNDAMSPAACKKGCYQCCCQPVPLSPPEALGLFEYVRFFLGPETRARLLQNCPNPKSRPASCAPCPLLLDGACQAYEMRPVACRRFIVGKAACQPGEDPARTRPQDLIIPSKSVFHDCLAGMSHFYEKHYKLFGLSEPPVLDSRQERVSFILSSTTIIQAYDWKKILSLP